jgi:hypothetical protein
MANQMEEIFQSLNDIIAALASRVNSLANKVEQLERGGGGGGNATVEDYEGGKLYKRNTLLVDTATETMYRVSCPVEYTSVSVEADRMAGNLKLIGFESQVITINHEPSQAELDMLPEDSLVAIYSTSANRYIPIINGDNPIQNDNNG